MLIEDELEIEREIAHGTYKMTAKNHERFSLLSLCVYIKIVCIELYVH